MLNWPTKMAKRKTLPQKMQEWYDSDAPGETADRLIADLHMNPENKVLLINLVGDTTLGLIPVADLPNQIQNYIAMPLPLARVLAEHLMMLLTEAHVLVPVVATTSAPTPAPVSTSAPMPAPPPPPPVQHQQPIQPAAPTPAAPPPQPVTPPVPTTWQHVQEAHEEKVHSTQQFTAIPPQTTSPQQIQPQTPPTIPQYQKPLTAVPQYRNADLYKKPPQ